jgi:hypothetical protein
VAEAHLLTGIDAVSRLQGILDRTNDVLDLSLSLIRLAVNLQLGVTDDLADGFFDRALDLLARSDDPVLIHSSILSIGAGPYSAAPNDRW